MKFTINYISVVCIVLTLLSCQDNAVRYGKHQVFRYNEVANIQTLDPAFSRNQAIIWPCNQLFNGLVQLDDKLRVQPDVAKSWEIDKQGLLYRFFLRKDVYFHFHANFGKDSTRTVEAKDFEFSFKRLKDEQLASPGAWILNKVADFYAENDSVFTIALKEPFPAFLGLLSMKYASVVPREVVEDRTHDFRSHPIGTGPFYFKFWEENVKLVLRKNSNYFERDDKGNRLPYLEAIAITFLPDKQSAFLQFVQGNIDFLSGLDPSYTDEIITAEGELQSKYRDRIKLVVGPYLNTEYLGFNMQSTGIASDKRVRNALNMGFNREKMLLYLRSGMGTATVGGMIPVGLEGTILNERLYDPEKAKKLLTSFREETGQEHLELTLATNASYLDIAEFLQREWQKLGVKVSVDVMPPSTLRQSIATGKVDFFRGSWIADYPDAENYLSLFYGPNVAPNGPNYTRFQLDAYDALYKKIFLTLEPEKRTMLYQQMDSLIMEETPVIVLFYDQAVRFVQKEVQGLGINPMNNLVLKRVYKNR